MSSDDNTTIMAANTNRTLIKFEVKVEEPFDELVLGSPRRRSSSHRQQEAAQSKMMTTGSDASHYQGDSISLSF